LRTLTDRISTEYGFLLMKYHNLILLPSDTNLRFFVKPETETSATVEAGAGDTPPDTSTWNEYGTSSRVPNPPATIRGRVR
jgi:hypothetical protein